MNATICRIVVYVLNHEDALAINRRRTSGPQIAKEIEEGIWPCGAQAHIGNVVEAGMEFPAMVVRDWIKETAKAGAKMPENSVINLQVFLDGNDVYWATSVYRAVGDYPSLEYGSWHWPVRDDVMRAEIAKSSALRAEGVSMPRYKCHKEVSALKIKAIDWINGGKACQITPVEAGFPPFIVTEEYYRKHQPMVGGYYVVYDDGYQSFSPAKAFEDGYTLIS